MRKVLIVVDMQNDFIDGALGTREAQAIVDRVVRVIGEYEPENIFATRDTHTAEYLQTQEGEHLPVPHCIRNTEGWQLQAQIAHALGDAQVFDKGTFGSIHLAQQMLEMQQKEPLDITLIGVCTDICVISNALLLKAYLPETPIHVLADCCAGVTPETHAAALTTMKMCQIDVRE